MRDHASLFIFFSLSMRASVGFSRRFEIKRRKKRGGWFISFPPAPPIKKRCLCGRQRPAIRNNLFFSIFSHLQEQIARTNKKQKKLLGVSHTHANTHTHTHTTATPVIQCVKHPVSFNVLSRVRFALSPSRSRRISFPLTFRKSSPQPPPGWSRRARWTDSALQRRGRRCR